jgi:hypothetical protein
MVIIYTLEHPLTGEIRYVGKTSRSIKARYYQHICVSSDSSYRANWIKSLNKVNLKPIIKELDVCESDGNDLERYWISQFKAWGFRLVNLTDGGEGVSGYKRDAEFSARMSNVHKGKEVSDITRDKIRESILGSKLSDLTKLRISEACKGKGNKPVFQYCKKSGRLIAEHINARDASRVTGIIKTAITNCCNGRAKTSGGYYWSYNKKNINNLN